MKNADDRSAAQRGADAALTFPQRVLFVALIVALALLLWQLSDVILLLFGAIIVAVVLRALATPFEKYLKFSARIAVGAAVVMTVLALTAGSWLIGDQLIEQFANLQQRLPKALAALTNWLNELPFGPMLVGVLKNISTGDVPWSKVANVATQTVSAIGSIGLILLVGVYLAMDPVLYRNGFVRMIPTGYRPQFNQALIASGHALLRWLLGQSISMLFVGSTTAIGLMMLGMPLALSLGVIAGILGFIPYFGPIASGILIVLLAFMDGTTQALYVAFLCIAIQQVEGSLLMPLVQRWAVELPAVLGIMSAVIFALLFGLPGIIFATPMMVVVMVLVKKLYIEDVLEEHLHAGKKR